MKFGKSAMRPDWQYKLGNDRLQQPEKEKDLKVIINNRLSPEEHIQETVRNIHTLLANMRIAFSYTDKEMVKKINTSFIRPTLEYAAVVWNPHLKKYRENREGTKSSHEVCATS